jgi:hypothetical protein
MSSAEEDLEWLIQAAYEHGLTHGFTIGKARSPRPEDEKVLRDVANTVRGKISEGLKATMANK